MPELPEVQTIISDLNKKIKGDTITGFWSDWPKAIKNLSVDKFTPTPERHGRKPVVWGFTKEIKGRKILGARRIGKNIFIDLSGRKTLYIHLKMTGHLLVKSKVSALGALPAGRQGSAFGGKSAKLKVKSDRNYFSEKVNQYIHHIWHLGKNKTLEFSDLRKFGGILLFDTDKLNTVKEIKGLGIDAMSLEFTEKYFNELLKKQSASRRKKIRDILMDQGLISGIGNIYMSEVLFEAGILPTRPGSKMSARDRKRLFNAIKKVLEKAIKLRGTSDSDYRDTSGAPGNFQKVLRVYRREGQECGKCGTIIKRLKVGQRSAFFCPKCQK